ncbi:hypothetical protein [Alloalcanivorax marinus]|uniref:hypothetical protein n=1 Tax=Alloalcanivorax marinus TaxID=1177169 RepID=UPI0019597A46|nr:hypothetical protein [Alloalcanivorax marinus]MBM7334547.1 hypothetical protein [Alloalcanivorax marinus]
MYRVYYLVRSLDQVKVALNGLKRAGIGDNRTHVVTRDNGQLRAEGVHATTPWEDTNLMTNGFYGALVGGGLGLLVGWALSGIDPWGVQIGFLGVVLCVLFFGAHGAWTGGMWGISQNNRHLKPYLKDIRRGFYLLMVDVDSEPERERVHRVLDTSVRAERRDDQRSFSPFF